MTRRFALVAGTTAVFVTVVLVMVIARDMAWLTTVGSDPAAGGRALIPSPTKSCSPWPCCWRWRST